MSQTEIPATRWPGRLTLELSGTAHAKLMAKARKMKTTTGALVYIAVRDYVTGFVPQSGLVRYEVHHHMGTIFIFVKVTPDNLRNCEAMAYALQCNVREVVKRAFLAKWYPPRGDASQGTLQL